MEGVQCQGALPEMNQALGERGLPGTKYGHIELVHSSSPPNISPGSMPPTTLDCSLSACDLPHLGQPHHEEVMRLLVVELCQVPQESCQPCIVCPRPDQPHAEYSIPCNSGVAVMGERAERIQDWELWVRGGEEAQSEGNCTADHRVTVTKLHGREEVRFD